MKATAVQRWDGSEVSEPVEGEAPAVTPAVPVAGRCPPTTARELNHLAVPAYVNVYEPVCEDLEGPGALHQHRPRSGPGAQRR